MIEANVSIQVAGGLLDQGFKTRPLLEREWAEFGYQCATELSGNMPVCTHSSTFRSDQLIIQVCLAVNA